MRLAPRSLLAGLLGAGMLQAVPAWADPFPKADLATGKQHHDKLCVSCHAKKFGGTDGTDIYTRFERRVASPDSLKQQLTACTTMLNLDLFPEDEHHIAGYLNKHYYKFK